MSEREFGQYVKAYLSVKNYCDKNYITQSNLTVHMNILSGWKGQSALTMTVTMSVSHGGWLWTVGT